MYTNGEASVNVPLMDVHKRTGTSETAEGDKSQETIHDVVWNPTAKHQFLTLQGLAKNATLAMWDGQKCKLQSCIIKGPYNRLHFSPSYRYVCVAGFGNLAGHVAILDRKQQYGCVGFFQDHSNPGHLQWTSDELHIVCSTLYPRLRVNNQARIFTFNGTCIYTYTCPTNRLQQVCFLQREIPQETNTTLPLVATTSTYDATAKVIVTSAADGTTKSKYIPPHLRTSNETNSTSVDGTSTTNENANATGLREKHDKKVKPRKFRETSYKAPFVGAKNVE
uniref:Eukaryotic translation initiation factor 2A n=1 Tax=Lygus hesperus TaxID=30085 RepID=A0A0A9X9C9_LYGHE